MTKNPVIDPLAIPAEFLSVLQKQQAAYKRNMNPLSNRNIFNLNKIIPCFISIHINTQRICVRTHINTGC